MNLNSNTPKSYTQEIFFVAPTIHTFHSLFLQIQAKPIQDRQDREAITMTTVNKYEYNKVTSRW